MTAQTACANSDFEVTDHFLDVRKMVDIGSGAQRELEDIALSRYACYLIAQNGDPSKDPIAFAQTYFAVQTRKMEVIEQRLAEMERLTARKKLTVSERQLSGIIFERLADNQSFARIRSKGDQALFGGLTTQDMKDRLMSGATGAFARPSPIAVSYRSGCRLTKTSRRSNAAFSWSKRSCPNAWTGSKAPDYRGTMMNHTSRRSFLKRSVGASAALLGANSCASPWLRAAGANDDVRLAVVDVGSRVKIGGQGRNEIRSFRQVPGVRVVALWDVDDANLGPEV